MIYYLFVRNLVVCECGYVLAWRVGGVGGHILCRMSLDLADHRLILQIPAKRNIKRELLIYFLNSVIGCVCVCVYNEY